MAITPERFVADNQKLDTKCAGDRTFNDCPTAANLMHLTDSFARDPGRDTADGNYNLLKTQEFTLGCVVCKHVCYLARMIEEGVPTQPARIYCELSAQ